MTKGEEQKRLDAVRREEEHRDLVLQAMDEALDALVRLRADLRLTTERIRTLKGMS